MTMYRPLIIAHRGFSAVAPENTLLAFRQARAAGADGIELDVRLTRDREIVVMHDARVNRTTNGTGMVGDFTLTELQQLDAGSWFSPQAASERVPTLREVCELMVEWGGVLNIELETQVFLYPGLEQLVLEMIHEYNIEKQIILSSFNHQSLQLCKQLAPEISTAPLTSTTLYQPWNYATTFRANGIHPLHLYVDKAMVTAAHAVGVEVRPWTIDEPAELQRLIDCGVDAIITNRPDTVLQLLA